MWNIIGYNFQQMFGFLERLNKNYREDNNLDGYLMIEFFFVLKADMRKEVRLGATAWSIYCQSISFCSSYKLVYIFQYMLPTFNEKDITFDSRIFHGFSI